MRDRTTPDFLLASAMPQLIGLAVGGAFQLLVPRERRIVVGCALFALGLIVIASPSPR